MTASDQHDLYRHFDAEGNLLYVGISYNALNRLSEHRKSAWASDIASVTIETYPNREAVLEAEKAAIISEKPVHNTLHNETTQKALMRFAKECGGKRERQLARALFGPFGTGLAATLLASQAFDYGKYVDDVFQAITKEYTENPSKYQILKGKLYLAN